MEVDVEGATRPRPYQEKINQVLHKLLEPNFKIGNNDYLNKLYTHMKTFYETANTLERNSFNIMILEWTKTALDVYEKKKPSNANLSFVLNLFACLSKDESLFVNLNSINSYERLIVILNIPTVSPNIKLGFIKLLSAFLDHKSGIQWSLETFYWSHVIEYTLQNFTVSIEKEGCKYINKCLSKAGPVNELFTKYVIRLILIEVDALLDISSLNGKTNLEASGQMRFETVLPTLKLLTNILEEQLTIFDVNVIDLILVEFQLNGKMKRLLLMANTEQFYYKVLKLFTLIQMIEFFKEFSEYKIINYDKIFDPVKEEEGGIAGIFNKLLKKDYLDSMVKILYHLLKWWITGHTRMPSCHSSGKNVDFKKQNVILQFIPVTVTTVRLCGWRCAIEHVALDESRDQFMTKILMLFFTRTMKTVYNWRDQLIRHPNIFPTACLAIKYITKSMNLYDRDDGVMIFQAYVYFIQDCTAFFKTVPESAEGYSKFTILLEMVLETTTHLIETFDITWKDSVETICVMMLTIELLNIPTWGPKLVTKLLKLLNITIIKYMSPNMALLVDNSDDPTMTLMGPLLYTKCHDSDWEVRDSAIETLCTICYNANTKFPTFQTVILDSNLPKLMVDLGFEDTEPYVRASSLKCLQEMIKVEEFWRDILVNNVHKRICDTLIKETEGVVRTEAATLIYQIYVDQKFPDSLMGHLYDVMTHAANADLHWEVKVNALKFWEAVVNKHLQLQGMIDGTFPKVTFSKEQKKIVVLNSKEVQSRLTKVLNQLSQIGCLAVLVAALQDEDDFNVVKEAVRIINDFNNHLKTYKIFSENANLSEPPSPLYLNISLPAGLNSSQFSFPPVDTIESKAPYNSSILSFSNDSTNLANNVPKVPIRAADVTDVMLDDLLNASDMTVLETQCIPAENLDNSHIQMLRPKNILLPGDFINIICHKLDSSVSDKSKCFVAMDDFDSLLDNILHEYNSNINDMDCY